MIKFSLQCKSSILIVLIFIVAIIIRFLYFPNNVYFSFDQARDSFTALEILKGDLKLVGPPSYLSDKLFPGPLIFYIYAIIYSLFDKNPEAVSAVFRVWNSLGVFPVFFIGSILFNKRTGLIAAIFFAFSYEQSQYALFIAHQPLAVITVLLFYLGLVLYHFKEKAWALVLSAIGLGLSMQFHYGYIFLILTFMTYTIIFRKKLNFLPIKWVFVSCLVFFLTTFTYLLSELKYHNIASLFQSSGSAKLSFFSGLHPRETLFIVNRFLHDSFLADYQFTPFISIALLLGIGYLLYQKKQREKGAFLVIWFIFGLSLYFLSGTSTYYYSAATSVSLFLLSSFFIAKLFSTGKALLGLIIILLIILNNLSSVFTINPHGLNLSIIIQPDMLTSSQTRALDYIYQQTRGKPFAVNALTVPLNINVTWSYLFEWYGQKRYGYLPSWIGPTASGYAGYLKVINARLQLPEKQFLIIEPTNGIREKDKENFFREEGYFTKVLAEKSFGSIIVQTRQPY